jgi:hypothetical protein
LPARFDRRYPLMNRLRIDGEPFALKRRWKDGLFSIVNGLLAATALQHSLAIVSRNVSDFASGGVRVVNRWEAQSSILGSRKLAVQHIRAIFRQYDAGTVFAHCGDRT